MKKLSTLKLILAGLCLTGLITAATIAAVQISLDAPASLPSDI
jgi:hypothetical protein